MIENIFNEFLRLMVANKASDLYIKPFNKPVLRIEGELYPIEFDNIRPDFTETVFEAITSVSQKKQFDQNPELNLIYSAPLQTKDRFRINFYKNKGYISLVIRRISGDIPDLKELNLPSILKKFVLKKKGLIIICGPTGTGKSTTLASLLNYVNQNFKKHIVTIEDPIEYVLEDINSIVSQREVGIDTKSFEEALKNVVRQTPDIIMVGETRDRETANSILQLAETGHLILTTLHSPNTVNAIIRLLQFFEQQHHKEIINYLSANLISVVSQKLVPSLKGGRVPVVEILINNARMQELMLDFNFKQMRAEIDQFIGDGMQSFDISLIKLYSRGLISLETALEYAEIPHDLNLKIKTLGIKPGKELPSELEVYSE